MVKRHNKSANQKKGEVVKMRTIANEETQNTEMNQNQMVQNEIDDTNTQGEDEPDGMEDQVIAKGDEQSVGQNEGDMTLEELVTELTNGVDPKEWKNHAWWNNIPKGEQFKPGDIVYDTKIAKFGIFIEPARKEGLVKIRLLKRKSKTGVYTRDWYLPFDDIDLVKRGGRTKREYMETNSEFLKRAVSH